MSPETRGHVDALANVAEIVEDLEAALEQFREILADMGPEAAEVT
ncbi:MAG: hypothetical protein FD187_1558 [bacterium]|nr:MAG: hypothetical protein FD142_205 [bacterium]KAF0149010.1 MAG: hypothetical protein FD187_1558 [bacterium]KAF0166003.1 MAG: hypothetical protein FD158_2754 [bacterium]TXT18296.1 MAG: hypothetical protein FD132_2126 [bacterium]